jgi:hypothetical protein
MWETQLDLHSSEKNNNQLRLNLNKRRKPLFCACVAKGT